MSRFDLYIIDKSIDKYDNYIESQGLGKDPDKIDRDIGETIDWNRERVKEIHRYLIT